MIQKINSVLNNFFNIEIIKTHPKEAIKFAKKYFKDKKIEAIEIGVLKGESSLAMIKNLNLIKLNLIDPYTRYSDYKKDGNYKNIKLAKKLAKKRLAPCANKINWIFDYSENAYKKIDEQVDFIYIDGNHEYEYVKKDLELYWPKLKNNGIFSGHDIQSLKVSKAVLEFANKKGVDIHFGERRDWWIIKK